jgi:hypothetical protein
VGKGEVYKRDIDGRQKRKEKKRKEWKENKWN